MGNNEAWKHLESQSQTPGNTKWAQRKCEAYDNNWDRQYNIQWSQLSKQMHLLYLCQLSHQGILEVKHEQIVYLRRLPASQTVVKYLLSSARRWNQPQSYGPAMVPGLVMPLSSDTGMHDSNHANQRRTISPSISAANHEISVPPPSPDKCKIHPPPSHPTKGIDKAKDEMTLEGSCGTWLRRDLRMEPAVRHRKMSVLSRQLPPRKRPLWPLLLLARTRLVQPCMPLPGKKAVHQQNVNRFGSPTQTSQTLWWTSPVLPSNSTSSQASLERSKVRSDCARAFSGAPESTCSSGGPFRMLRDLAYRIVKIWSSWDLCTGLRRLREQLETSAQLSGRLSAVFSQQ